MLDKITKSKKTKRFLTGFKEFITRGNVIDLAVGVIIGSAFGKIVTSLVNDIITPPISLLFRSGEIKDAKWVLRPLITNAENVVTQTEVALRYGNLLMLVIEFLIIAFTIYATLTLIIRRREFLEKVKAEELAEIKAKEVKKVVIPEDIKLLREIRDLLKDQEA